MEDEFYLKGVLEKLSPTQVTIYTSLLKSKGNVLTLGEIARKISMPPVNAEMELGVLKRYFLLYQRKNRERLTNNLDRYHHYPESGSLVRMDTNEKGQKFKLNLSQILDKDNLPAAWKKVLSNQTVARAGEAENIERILDTLNDQEKALLLECFLQGGILEISRAREFLQSKKAKWEAIVRKMHELCLLVDDYYIDERFIRLLTMPADLFQHLQENPILPNPSKGTKRRQESRIQNDLDFYINLKKMIVYISRKGLNLAKSGKIKQVDLKETASRLLRPDISLFLEKSEIYQIELLLPVMRLLDIVRVKRDDVVLRNDFDSVLTEDLFGLMKRVIAEIGESRNRVVRYEDVFESLYVPFFQKAVFDECVELISKRKRVVNTVIMAEMIREKLVLSKKFRIKDFQTELTELRKELVSALFFLQLLGLVVVEYPDRWIEISDLGLYYFKNKPLDRKDEKGGIIINPDLSVIAIPEQISLRGLSLLKIFSELKSFDNVYTFQITRESFQDGLLLKANPEEFVSFLENASRGELPQNLTFSIDDWSRNFPLVTITDECVVLQTEDPNHMELLLGQISGKKIVLQEISPTTILIDSEKIYDTIIYAEKLNLIVKLIR